MYASLDEFKTWIGGSGDEGFEDHHLEPILNAAARWIDQHTGRHFTLENEVTKLYYPNAQGVLDVVDLVSVTTLKTDTSGDRTYATTIAAGAYELLPYRDAAGRPSVRYDQIRIWPTSSTTFGPGRLVQIVGDFGYVVDGLPPDEVRLASLILASRWWKRHETPLGVLGVSDLGQFERISKEDPEIDTLLGSYMRTGNAWVLV